MSFLRICSKNIYLASPTFPSTSSAPPGKTTPVGTTSHQARQFGKEGKTHVGTRQSQEEKQEDVLAVLLASVEKIGTGELGPRSPPPIYRVLPPRHSSQKRYRQHHFYRSAKSSHLSGPSRRKGLKPKKGFISYRIKSFPAESVHELLRIQEAYGSVSCTIYLMRLTSG